MGALFAADKYITRETLINPMSILQSPNVQDALKNLSETFSRQSMGEAGRFIKNSLNGGELSPGMSARHDQPRFISGCHKLLNMVPLPCGGITKRPGFKYLGAAQISDSSRSARLVPFIFSANEARMLEMCETSAGNVVVRVWNSAGQSYGQQLTLPWPNGTLATVSFCQSADILYCASSKFRPAKIMRYSDTSWKYETINWMPQIAAPAITAITEQGDGTGSRSNLYYTATAVDAETGEESGHGNVAVINVQPLSSDHHVLITVAPVAGASEYRIYKKRSGLFGYIGRITNAGAGVFEDTHIEADTEDTPPNHSDPFAQSYPSIVFMHQQRLGFASSNARPLTIWLSQAGNFQSMASSTPPKSDDAIEATLAAPEANRILWAQSDRSGLVFGTTGGEWLLTSGEGAAISPSDLSFQPQTYFGSEPGMPVLRAGASLLYLQRGGLAVREYGYSFSDDRYNSADLSLLARHILADNPVVAWCWQPEPHGIIWCVLYDGSIAGLTYLREHDVVAWHRHKTNGWIETIASMPGPNGATQVWTLCFRGNTRYVERLHDFVEPGSNVSVRPPHADGINSQGFEARCVPCIAESQTESGSTYGLLKKINVVKLQVIDSAGIKAQITSQDASPGKLVQIPQRGSATRQEAMWSANLAAGFREAPRLELICDGTAPVTILGLAAHVELSTNIGNQI